MKAKTPELLKFKRLARRLNESVRGTVGLLEMLWQGTAKNAPEGDVGRFSNEEIATMCDWPGDADALITALVETSWLDECPTYRLVVHHWDHHAPDYVKANLRRWNKEFAIGPCSSKAERSVPSVASPDGFPPDPVPVPVPDPNPPLPQPEAAEADDLDWGEAASLVVTAGVGTGFELVDDCRERGCQPSDVRGVVAFWESHKPEWGIGALVFRLGNLMHGQDPGNSNLWPPPSGFAAAENSSDRERVAAEAAKKRAEGEARREAAKAEEKRLEREHGATVNNLTEDEVRELVRQLKLPAKAPPAGKDTKGFLRDGLLAYFDSQKVTN